jgi:hypothetical protein
MAVSDAHGARPGPSGLKAAGPTAAAIGIITTIIGVSLLASSPETPTAIPPATLDAPSTAAMAAPDPAQPGLPGIQFNQPAATGAPQTGIEIVVKFKNDGPLKDIIDSFWRDQASAKAKFEAWKANRPEFAKLKLDRVTYSNELVLVHDGSGAVADRLPAMKAIAAKLGSVADISYAEPNMTAHPGGQ